MTKIQNRLVIELLNIMICLEIVFWNLEFFRH